MEVSEEKANQRVEEFKREMKTLTVKLKEAENRAENAEKSVKRLQKEVDRLEGTYSVNHFRHSAIANANGLLLYMLPCVHYCFVRVKIYALYHIMYICVYVYSILSSTKPSPSYRIDPGPERR